MLPDDIDFTLEMVVSRMIGLLLIEISAFHGFKWAEAVLSDTELVAGEGEAARVISYVRADETPHVAYLRTALSEMRDRTWVGEGGEQPQGHRDDLDPVGPRARRTRCCCAGPSGSRCRWPRSTGPSKGAPTPPTSSRRC